MALSMRLGSDRPSDFPHDDSFDDTAARGRTVGGRVGLPTGRALVGGLLVALSALGIFAAHRAATADHTANFLILTKDVSAGRPIEAADLALAPMNLYETTRQQAHSNPEDVIGRIALVPLHEGDLVLTSSTGTSASLADTPARRVGLSLNSADALGGDVAIGDRVDVVSVPRSDEPADVIVHGALVTSVGGATDATVGSDAAVQLNLDVASEDAARRLIEAHARGGVTLIAASTLKFDTSEDK